MIEKSSLYYSYVSSNIGCRMLIEKCVCGKPVDESFNEVKMNDLVCASCPSCGTLHQRVDLTEQQYYDFYTNYHIDYQKTLGQTNYADRYEHDCDVAKMRLEKYKEYLKGSRLLDIGSSNGAFVDEARKVGLDAWGVEPNADISRIETTYQGTLIEQNFLDREFDNATMHDVLEHVIEPIKDLKECHRILSDNGLLILDMPNFWVPEGIHHWRPTEHLWLFSEENLCELLESNGWRIAGTDIPIPSKYVIYAEKAS